MKCNGIELPNIGYGTYNLLNTKKSVVEAVQMGYRLIDTASVYENLEEIGDAVRYLTDNNIIERQELFLSSKIAPVNHGYYKTLSDFEETINKLQCDYLDIYMIHWPVAQNMENDYISENNETWIAMQELFQNKKVRIIGVSNFLERHLYWLCKNAKIKPMINQLEINPLYQQVGLRNICREFNILVEGWSPLGGGEWAPYIS